MTTEDQAFQQFLDQGKAIQDAFLGDNQRLDQAYRDGTPILDAIHDKGIKGEGERDNNDNGTDTGNGNGPDGNDNGADGNPTAPAPTAST